MVMLGNRGERDLIYHQLVQAQLPYSVGRPYSHLLRVRVQVDLMHT